MVYARRSRVVKDRADLHGDRVSLSPSHTHRHANTYKPCVLLLYRSFLHHSSLTSSSSHPLTPNTIILRMFQIHTYYSSHYHSPPCFLLFNCSPIHSNIKYLTFPRQADRQPLSYPPLPLTPDKRSRYRVHYGSWHSCHPLNAN